MKQVFFVWLSIVITHCALAQGITKNGKLTATITEYVNKNGAIGTTSGVNKNGEIVSAVSLAVGDSYQGGIVGYILQSGDQGYVAGEVHGLIAASADLSSASWGCTDTDIAGTLSGIGYGNANTILITAGCATAGIAARECADLTLNGYSDWYLPSIDELKILMTNKDLIGGVNVSYPYWSSTQQSSSRAYFSYRGSYRAYAKDRAFLVRPVRSF